MHLIPRICGSIALVAFLCACSPYHDLKNGSGLLGGGFKDQEVSPGLFGILVKSNVALWTNRDAVHDIWSRRAHELCGGDYIELASQELDETLKPINSEVLRDHVTSRIAFALCTSSKLSQQEALDVIERLGLLPAPPRIAPM
jgi:hypothetical protein